MFINVERVDTLGNRSISEAYKNRCLLLYVSSVKSLRKGVDSKHWTDTIA